ncbi:hypothetical protein FLM55_04245 [Francisella sp. Scap27]|uniref:ubiquinone biosynthesis accessory factor UbiJ n=1 Tax=Francisella sp. Scap27 TaxID=2589986 RepID=UPI0015B91AD5|nr:SCP2 sterol-binding domain-containing protein [Francisella sp. Scap27]QLE78985.1 hypothetical protein FLM55_04245 [Francisella sp. Scap27]
MIETINKALTLLPKLDPQVPALLLPLNGKPLSVHISDLDYTITLEVKNQTLTANTQTSKNLLSGKLAFIIELVFNKNLQELIMTDKLNYEGSLKDLKEFYTFFEAIDIDIIYKISQATSPEFANIVAKPFTKAREYLKTSRGETLIDIKDYLTEEKKILISQNEIDIFYRDIKELKQAVDRIEAKYKLLQGQLND